MKKIKLSQILTCALVLTTSLVASSDNTIKAPANIFAALLQSKDHTIVAKVSAAKQQEANAKGNMSVFAPTDKAFAKVNKKYIEGTHTPEQMTLIQKVLKHHATSELLLLKNLKDGQKIKQIDGEMVTIRIKNNQVSVNGIPVVSTISTPTGTVFVIDKILYPPSVIAEMLEK